MKKEMKKSVFVSVIVISLILLTLVIATTYTSIPNPGHGGDDVYIFINNTEMTLQEAILNNTFNNCSVTGGTYSSLINLGHSGEEIIVNVNGTKTTLQEAINNKKLLSSNNTGTSPADYAGYSFPPQYQTAEEVAVQNSTGENEKTLQDAINDGWFECTPEVPEVISPECRYDGSFASSCSPIGDNFAISRPLCRGNYPLFRFYWDSVQIYFCMSDHCANEIILEDENEQSWRYYFGDWKEHNCIDCYHELYEICRELV